MDGLCLEGCQAKNCVPVLQELWFCKFKLDAVDAIPTAMVSQEEESLMHDEMDDAILFPPRVDARVLLEESVRLIEKRKEG